MDDNTQTTTSSPEPWSSVQPYLESGYAGLTNLYNQGRSPYPWQTYTAANPLQHYANEQMIGYADNALPGQVQNVQNAQQSMLGAADIDSNPYVQNLAQRMNERIGQDFNENIMPGIRNQSMATNTMGSSRQGIAEGLAAGRAADAMSNSTAQLYSDAYNRGLDQQYRGMTLAPQTAQFGMMPYDIYNNAGQFLRDETDLALQDDINRYDSAINQPWDDAISYLSALQGIPFGSTSTTEMPSNTAGNVLGGAMTGYGLASDMGFSSPWLGAFGGGLLGVL